MASNLYYDIKVTLHFNEFDLDSLDESVLAYNKKTFGAVSIGMLLQTKTFFGEKEALAQIRLNNIPQDLVKELNKNGYYLEIAVFQKKAEFYRNFYKVISASTITAEGTPLLGQDLVNSDILLKSMLLSNLEKDKSLTDVQADIQSDVGYVKSKDLLYDKLPSALINTYGTGFQIINRLTKNINKTGYKTLAFPVNISNKDSIDEMYRNYPISLNHHLYGYDEGFDSRTTKNIAELITVDVTDTDSWLNQSAECLAYEKDPEVVIQSRPTVVLEGNYFPSNFSDTHITCRQRITNTIDGSTYDREPFAGKVTRVPVFNKSEDGFSSIAGTTKDNSSLELIETTLSESDYILQQEALVELYNKSPKIYTVSYGGGCPYDMGRLGRKSNLPPEKHNLIINADISFLPSPNPENEGKLLETPEKEDPFKCIVEVQTLSYN